MKKERSKELQQFLSNLKESSFHEVDFTDISAVDYENENALHKALWAEEFELAHELVALGIELNVAGDMGYTPLHVAVNRAPVELVRVLVENGANVFALNEFDKTAIMDAVGENVEAFQYLKKVMPRSEGLIKFLRALMETLGKEVNDSEALKLAVIHDHVAIVKELICLGADREQVDESGRALMHHAASVGNLEMVKLLVKFVCITNQPDTANFAPIQLADVMEHKEVVLYLKKVWGEIEKGKLRRLRVESGIDC